MFVLSKSTKTIPPADVGILASVARLEENKTDFAAIVKMCMLIYHDNSCMLESLPEKFYFIAKINPNN